MDSNTKIALQAQHDFTRHGFDALFSFVLLLSLLISPVDTFNSVTINGHNFADLVNTGLTVFLVVAMILSTLFHAYRARVAKKLFNVALRGL